MRRIQMSHVHSWGPLACSLSAALHAAVNLRLKHCPGLSHSRRATSSQGHANPNDKVNRETRAATMPTTRSGKQLDATARVTKPRRDKKTAPKPPQDTQTADAGPSTSPALFFWRETDPHTGWLSQWYPCAFTDNDGVVYKTAEHYMMYQKALLFSDPYVGAQILAAAHPRLVKALGRKVASFDDKVWNRERERIVRDGTRFKFTRAVSEEGLKRGDAKDAPLVAPLTLRGLLLATGDREIVEASPMDRIWGVGFGPAKAEGARARWGLNLLGKALMVVRGELQAEEVGEAEE